MRVIQSVAKDLLQMAPSHLQEVLRYALDDDQSYLNTAINSLTGLRKAL